jgi:hypothetical protein
VLSLVTQHQQSTCMILVCLQQNPSYGAPAVVAHSVSMA